MANTLTLTPKNFSLEQARTLVEAVTANTPDSRYYLFYGKPTEWPGNTTPQPVDSVQTLRYDAWTEMTMGKRISSADIALVVPRHDYVANTVYSTYDQEDPDLQTRAFYVGVNDTSAWHVFKCLDNNSNSASTVTPNFADTDPTDELYQASDGYVWKYMYSVTPQQAVKFATSASFPAYTDTGVAAAAVPGSVDVTKVLFTGSGYGNYTNGTFAATDTRLQGNSLLFAIGSGASSSNDYYTGCVLHLTSGTGAGQYRTVIGYSCNATTKWVTVNAAFDTVPQNGTQYEILPGVTYWSAGRQLSNAVGACIVNAFGNTIQSIEQLSAGAGYQVVTANVAASNVVGVTSLSLLQPVLSPGEGHGSDPAAELGCTGVAIGLDVSNTEGDTLPGFGAFRQVGILAEPLFRDVVLQVSNLSGGFIPGENVWAVDPIQLAGLAVLSSGNAVVAGTNTSFTNCFSAGDPILLQDTQAQQSFYGSVLSVQNAAQLTLASAPPFSTTDALVLLPRPYSVSVVESVGAGEVTVTNSDGMTLEGAVVVSDVTSTLATVSAVLRSNVAKGYDTFCQLLQLDATSGALANGEQVYQGNSSTANGYLYGYTSTRIFIAEEFGEIEPGQLTGLTSGATANVTARWASELVFGSGRILYLENGDPVTRSNTATEAFVLNVNL